MEIGSRIAGASFSCARDPPKRRFGAEPLGETRRHGSNSKHATPLRESVFAHAADNAVSEQKSRIREGVPSPRRRFP
ncbi:MAG: hypothetical protein PUE02_05740 [Eggerthellaceae bacterium]|nr:hypothetical protein [Eggerthellaceae bacterium]